MKSHVLEGLVLLILCISFTDAESSVTHNLGASAGFPQMIALTYQATVSGYLSAEVYAGSLALLNGTAGARLIVGSTSHGIKPRCFIGLSVVDKYYAEYLDSPRGTEFYFWTGAGLVYTFPSGFRIFADLGYIGDGARDKGLGYSTGMSISGGVLFRL